MTYNQARNVVMAFQQANNIRLWIHAYQTMSKLKNPTAEQAQAVAVISENFARLLNPEQVYQKES
jgi:hypothetical protein